MLIMKGVRIDPNKDRTIKKNMIDNEKITVSSLINIFFKTLFNCSNIYFTINIYNFEL